MQMEKSEADFELDFDEFIDRTCRWIDVGGKGRLLDFWLDEWNGLETQHNKVIEENCSA